MWLADRIRLFVHYTISLSSLCKLIKCMSGIFVECVSKIAHILSVIHYTIYFPCDDWENICFVLLSSSNRKYELLSIVRVRSWNNGMRCTCMSLFILMIYSKCYFVTPQFSFLVCWSATDKSLLHLGPSEENLQHLHHVHTVGTLRDQVVRLWITKTAIVNSCSIPDIPKYKVLPCMMFS